MKGLYIHGLVLFLGMIAVACGNSTQKKQTNTEASVKEKMPADYVESASFQDLEGDTVNLSEYKGKVVLIDFWETWCKPCIGSFPTIQKLIKEYPDNFVVLAVTPGFSDSKEDARQFKEHHDYDFNYLYDSTQLNQKLNVSGIPFKVFVDTKGNFIKTYMGSNGPEGDYKEIKAVIEKYKQS